jgi:hypothetical protein
MIGCILDVKLELAGWLEGQLDLGGLCRPVCDCMVSLPGSNALYQTIHLCRHRLPRFILRRHCRFWLAHHQILRYRSSDLRCTCESFITLYYVCIRRVWRREIVAFSVTADSGR